MSAPSDQAAADKAERSGDRFRTAPASYVYVMDAFSYFSPGVPKRFVEFPGVVLDGDFGPVCSRCSCEVLFTGEPSRSGGIWTYPVRCHCCAQDDEILSLFRLVVGGPASWWLARGWTWSGWAREDLDTEPAPAATMGPDDDEEESMKRGAQAVVAEEEPEEVLELYGPVGGGDEPEPDLEESRVEVRRHLFPENGAPAEEVFIPPVQDWAVADLVDADYNPREITERELADLQASIEDFGLVEDVVVNVHPDRRGVVVGGHQKLKILRAKGVQRVPCKEVNLTLDRERELNARLNANGGRFSARLLVEGGYAREDLESWGLRDDDLAAFDKAAEDFKAAEEEAAGGGYGGGEEFPSIDPDAATKHHCPRCHFEWN